MDNNAYILGKKLYIVALIFTGAALICFALYHITGYQAVNHESAKCYVNAVWHLYCPGCGGTRALDYLLHGHLIKSFLSNPIDLYTLILYLCYFIPATYTFVIKKDGKLHYRFHPISLISLLVLTVSFFILRNVFLVVWGIDYLDDCASFWV